MGARHMTGRISRLELATFRPVWLATGWMYAVFAVATFGLLMLVSGISVHRAQVLIVWLAFAAIVHLRSEAPEIGTVRNHLVLVCMWASIAAAFVVAQPGGGLAVGGAMFIGPLIALRLQDRRQIVLHTASASTLLLLVAGLGIFTDVVDHTTILTSGFCAMACVVQCASCTNIFEAAEAQGDELERIVRRDPLTGLGNRRLLEERLGEELRRHERTGRSLAVVVLDLNDFKVINDELGHAEGDELLVRVAAAVVRASGEGATVVRPGGDEFTVLLPETTAEEAVRTGNAIRTAFAKVERPGGGGITAGLGIATYPLDALDAEVLLHVADERLLESKPPRAERAGDPSSSLRPAPSSEANA